MYNSVDIMTAIAREFAGEEILVCTSVGIGGLKVDELKSLQAAGAKFLVPVPEEEKEDRHVIMVESLEDATVPSGGQNVQR